MATRAGWRGVGAGFTVAALALSSCFYDSRWHEVRRAREAAANNAKPSALRATPEAGDGPADSPGRAARVLKLRAHATPRYAAEVVGWQERFKKLLDDANQILEPTLHVRLELAGADKFDPHAGEENLEAVVAELASLDPGEDVDWVAGLVGSVPRAEISFHELGVGRMPGKHLVMRAMNDAKEFDAIERNLSDIDEEERRKLYSIRKRHKTATVLLHELGHTLGVPHERDAKTIMHPRYNVKAEGFSESAAGLLRISLEHRLRKEAPGDRALASSMLEHVERTAESWVPGERDELLRKLRAAVAMKAPASGAASKEEAPAISAAEVAGLSEADRATYAKAVREQRAGRGSEAWDVAEPLFKKYPDVYAVQDLRCNLAMQLGGAIGNVQAHCERLLKLTKELMKGTPGSEKRPTPSPP